MALGLPEYVISAGRSWMRPTKSRPQRRPTPRPPKKAPVPVITQPVQCHHFLQHPSRPARDPPDRKSEADPTSGRTPLDVTYTFDEKNISPDTDPHTQSLDAITGSSIVITDSDPACVPAPVTSGSFNVGDANSQRIARCRRDMGLLLRRDPHESQHQRRRRSATPPPPPGRPKTVSRREPPPPAREAPARRVSGAAVVCRPQSSHISERDRQPGHGADGQPGHLHLQGEEHRLRSASNGSVTITGSSCGAATFVKQLRTATRRQSWYPGATWTFSCT